MANTVGEIIFMAIDNHPPKAMVDKQVTCACGWRGDGYLVHLASAADNVIHTARYKLIDPSGKPVRSNFEWTRSPSVSL